MASEVEIFRSYVHAYVRAIASARYRDLRNLQPAPVANIAHGGAGTAIALSRARAAGFRSRGVSPTRWSAPAIGDASNDAFLTGVPSSSILFGRAGTQLVQATVARGGARARGLAGLTRSVRSAHASNSRVVELANGLAGLLLAILRSLPSTPRLRKAAAELAGTIQDRLARRVTRPWRDVDATNFAHGWPGVLYALLSWKQHEGVQVPAWLDEALQDLASRWNDRLVEAPTMRGTWCAGAAGMVMLWAKAFEVTANVRFRAIARRAGRAALRYEPVATHLCCGKGGLSYALLALDRIDPGRGWREHAIAIGVRAVQTPLQSRWPNGLLWGHPGLVCLALDLIADVPLGFPLIEA